MLVNELSNLTQEAIDKRNRERPPELFDKVIGAMRSMAASGYDYIDYVFSDNKIIIGRVIEMLLNEGFVTQPLDDSRYRISWGHVKSSSLQKRKL